MPKLKSNFFEVNSHKASVRVTTNSIMMGGLFLILTLIWTSGAEHFSAIIVGQLILAVPLLYVSTLAYLKIGYAEKVFMWDALGWFTSNTGGILVLNAVGLMTVPTGAMFALAYFISLIVLMLIYSLINIAYNPHERPEKIFKFIFFLIVVLAGGLLPLLFGLV